MPTYFLSVIAPIGASLAAPAGAAHVVEVLRVEVAAGIEFVRKHADEIARDCSRYGKTYTALHVRDTLPEDEARAVRMLPPELRAVADAVPMPPGCDVALSMTEAGAVCIYSRAMRCEFYVQPAELREHLRRLAAEFAELRELEGFAL